MFSVDEPLAVKFLAMSRLSIGLKFLTFTTLASFLVPVKGTQSTLLTCLSVEMDAETDKMCHWRSTT